MATRWNDIMDAPQKDYIRARLEFIHWSTACVARILDLDIDCPHARKLLDSYTKLVDEMIKNIREASRKEVNE